MVPFEVHVITSLVTQTAGAIRALRNVHAYDYVVFTSKNAETIFRKKISSLGIHPMSQSRMLRVGPRADLLKLPLRGKRVLFPRSSRAPFDIVSALRRHGVTVHPIPLSTVRGAALTSKQRHALLSGEVGQLYFKSPSGIAGLLMQFRGRNRDTVRRIPALCIGKTTRDAAKKAGWKNVTINPRTLPNSITTRAQIKTSKARVRDKS